MTAQNVYDALRTQPVLTIEAVEAALGEHACPDPTAHGKPGQHPALMVTDHAKVLYLDGSKR